MFHTTTLAQVAQKEVCDCGFAERRENSWLSAVVAIAISSSSTPAYTEDQLRSLNGVLRCPRGCGRGLKQQRAFVLQGLEAGHLSLDFPYVKGTASAINERLTSYTERRSVRAEAGGNNASSSSSRAVYQLPERVKAFVWDEGDWKQQNSLVHEQRSSA